MKPIRIILLGMVFLSLTAFGAGTEPNPLPTTPRSFAVFGHDLLVLNIPTTWKHQVTQSAENDSPNIIFTSEQTKDFFAIVSPYWDSKGDPDFNKPEKIRLFIEAIARKEFPIKVEQEFEILECNGPEAAGYYFSFTSKESKSRGPYYGLFACVGTGELLLLTIIITETKDSPDITATLAAMQQAVQRKPKLDSVVQEQIVIPDQGWKIFFDSPKLTERQSLANDPSQYSFQAKAERFNIAVTVEKPKNKKKTHKACADAYWPKLKKSLAKKINKDSIIIFDNFNYYRVQYDTTEKFEGQEVRERHVRYYISFQEKWIEVHLSFINPSDADEAVCSIFDQSLRCGF